MAGRWAVSPKGLCVVVTLLPGVASLGSVLDLFNHGSSGEVLRSLGHGSERTVALWLVLIPFCFLAKWSQFDSAQSALLRGSKHHIYPVLHWRLQSHEPEKPLLFTSLPSNISCCNMKPMSTPLFSFVGRFTFHTVVKYIWLSLLLRTSMLENGPWSL